MSTDIKNPTNAMTYSLPRPPPNPKCKKCFGRGIIGKDQNGKIFHCNCKRPSIVK